MEISQNSAAGIVSWMLHEGRFNTRMREFGHELCQRIVAAGIPIVRSFCYVGTLHPQVAASAYIWKRGEAQSNRIPVAHGLEERPDFVQSPLMTVRRTGQPARLRLNRRSEIEVSVLAEFRGEGGTDYVALPMVWSNGEVNAISFLTDRPSGSSEADIAGLEEIACALGIIIELQSTRRIAKTLLDTYVGARTGAAFLVARFRGAPEKRSEQSSGSMI
jgi:adenylate cyclase